MFSVIIACFQERKDYQEADEHFLKISSVSNVIRIVNDLLFVTVYLSLTQQFSSCLFGLEIMAK
jgi:hypothetical protein